MFDFKNRKKFINFNIFLIQKINYFFRINAVAILLIKNKNNIALKLSLSRYEYAHLKYNF